MEQLSEVHRSVQTHIQQHISPGQQGTMTANDTHRKIVQNK